MCGVWLALEDIDADNGPLIYYPGSHRGPHFGNEPPRHQRVASVERGAHSGAYRKLWTT